MISRKWAFLIHLNLSILAFATLVLILWYFWFPGQLFWLDGGWHGLKLVAMVDLVLGPALTLILYKPGKKGLLFDLSVIAMVQIAALLYGFYATYQQQTVGLIFAEGKFSTLALSEHHEANKQLITKGEDPQSLKASGQPNPVHMFTPQPTAENLGKFLTDIFNGYPEPHARSDRFMTLESAHEELQHYQLSEEELKQAGNWPQIKQALGKTKLDRSDVEFYRFKARYSQGIALFDKNSLRVVRYVAEESASAQSVAAHDEQ